MSMYLFGCTVAGGIVGFGYQKLVGCRSGVCLITSNRWVATVYGAAMGYMMAK